jgi:hypothetical protein
MNRFSLTFANETRSRKWCCGDQKGGEKTGKNL